MTTDSLQVTPNGNPMPDSSGITIDWFNDGNHRPLAVEVDLGKRLDNGKIIADSPVDTGDQNFTHCRIPNLKPKHVYYYMVQNWADHKQLHGQMPGSAKTQSRSTHTSLIESRASYPQDGIGTFELVVPQGNAISHFTLTGQTVKEGSWQLVDTIPLPVATQLNTPAASLIRSFRNPRQLQVLARIMSVQGSDFVATQQFTPGTGPQATFQVVNALGDKPINEVTGIPALAQSDQGTFEMLVPHQGVFAHYTHTNETIEGPWKFVDTLKIPEGTQVVAVALAQSDGEGGFKAIARVTSMQGSDRLVAYEFKPTSGLLDSEQESNSEESGVQAGWQGPFDVVTKDGLIDHVTGTPALTQSIQGDQERLELLVPRDGLISHYTHSYETVQGPWEFVETLKPPLDNPQIHVVAVSLIQDDAGNLEVVARVSPPQGSDFMVSYEFTNNWVGPFPLVTKDGRPILAGKQTSPILPPLDSL